MSMLIFLKVILQFFKNVYTFNFIFIILFFKTLRWLRGPDHDVANEMRTLGFLECSTQTPQTNETNQIDKKVINTV